MKGVWGSLMGCVFVSPCVGGGERGGMACLNSHVHVSKCRHNP